MEKNIDKEIADLAIVFYYKTGKPILLCHEFAQHAIIAGIENKKCFNDDHGEKE